MQKYSKYCILTGFFLVFSTVFRDIWATSDPYEGINYKNTFDQSVILKATTGKKLSLTALDALLIKDLQQKKRATALNTIKKRMFTFLSNTISLALPWYIFSKIVSSYSKSAPSKPASAEESKADSENKPSSLLYQIADSAHKSLFYEVIKSFAESLHNILSDIWELTHPTGDRLLEKEILYVKKKRFLSPSLQKLIEEHFELQRNHGYIDPNRNVLNVALNIPVKSKKPNREALNILKDTVSGYTPEVFPQIKQAIKEHLRRFSVKNGPNISPKPILYLQGAPGIGKTFVAQKIAEAMKLPAVKVSLASDNPDDILGNSYNQPGRLLEALTSEKTGGVRNVVLILDEADRVFNDEKSRHLLNILLPLTDPSTTHIYNPFLRSEIDISHLFIIAIGNKPIQDPALASRFNIINFEGITLEYKKQVAYNNILPDLAYSEDPAYHINLNTLNEQQWAKINAIIEETSQENLRDLQRKLAGYFNKIRYKS